MSNMWINGERVDVSAVGGNENLLAFLRGNGLVGTKCGCSEGDCGACSVIMVDDAAKPRSVNSCLMLVRSLEGKKIWTVEGVRKADELHPVQAKMVGCYGSQCGYCTPGFIASMVECYHRDGLMDRSDIAEQLCGNLCRCTGYRPIREAMTESLRDKETNAWEFDFLEETGSNLVGKSAMAEGYGVYLKPENLAELLEMKKANPAAVLVAGATEVAVWINKFHRRIDCLIGLEGVRELKRIEKQEDEWWLGAGAALTDIDEVMRGKYPALDKLWALFASRQIRHRATLGGNLVTASPIGDSAPLLMALDAEVILVSQSGERRVPLSGFFVGYRKTAMRLDEVMLAVIIPRGVPGRCEFHKASKRREMDISTVSLAMRVVEDEGVVRDARMVFGGVAATTSRAIKAEKFLIGKTLKEIGEEFYEVLAAEFTPLTDVRGTAEYRRNLIRGLVEKFITGERSGVMDEKPGFDDSKFAGADSLRHESAVGHVTGTAMYVNDQSLGRDMLSVWPVVSKVARGKLLGIDVSEARQMKGVKAVLTWADVPGLNNLGPTRHDEPLFAEDEIFFRGQMIAAVIGESEELCRLAAEKVVVEVMELEPIIGIAAAMGAGSFHTDPRVLERGDVVKALEAAEFVMEGELEIGGQEHFYLETHSAWAEVDAEGGIFVSSSTQHPAEVQTIVAELMGVGKNEIVVESPRMGGGFGGKETQGSGWAALCVLASKKTGKAVRVQLDRDLDMEMSGKRHPFFARYRVGYDGCGRLKAAEVKLVSDGGWALDLSLPVNDRALFHLDNAYYIPHVRFEGRVAKTNVTSQTAFRGFGGPQGMLVIEEIMARVAQRIGMRPEVLRAKNFYTGKGETGMTHYGADVGEPRIGRIWAQLLETSDFEKRRIGIDEWNAGRRMVKRGLAITPVKFGISFTLKHYNQAGALVLIYFDGSVQVNHGGTEMGQGLHTKIIGVVMRELGVERDKIRLMHTRTDKVPNSSATAASSGADLNGAAVADACRQLKGRLDAVKREVGTEMTFAETVMAAYLSRVQLSAAGFYKTPDLDWDWNVGKGRPFYYYAWGSAVCEVEVDGASGMSKVRRVDILHDAGDSLNPGVDRGQIEGGFVQGMGWLTQEDLKWDEKGKLLSHSASTYAIPAFSDAPVDFRVSLLAEAAEDGTIHGSKAVGEPPLMLAISVREAIRDAVAAFGVKGDFYLPSPCSGEAVKGVIERRKMSR
ncbi:MAG: xanthine dehydrogenase molybdopterin binding subunit [Armatimonadetes bacterium]|nr:xanthine dehydrogenase molybdopterin binding subunit [Akkermansiaceae bacterium]